MPNPQQLMQYAGAAVTVIVLILGLLFGSGEISSSSTGSDTGAQTASSRQSNVAPSNGGSKADSDGCVKNTPDYFKCKQENSSIGKKNPRLTPSEIQQAKKDHFQQLVA